MKAKKNNQWLGRIYKASQFIDNLQSIVVHLIIAKTKRDI